VIAGPLRRDADESAGETRDRTSPFSLAWRRWGIPLSALLIARAVSAAVGIRNGASPFAVSSWARWDSGHYAWISRAGYVLEHCQPGSPYPPTAWCGNTGWFPLYPWMMRIANGALISLVFEALVVFVLWRWFLGERGIPALLLAAFFPGSIYQQAVFPVSLTIFCALAFIACCERERWIPAAVAGCGAAMAYSTGALLAPIALVWMFLRKRWNAWPMAGVTVGYLAVLAVFQLQTGAWNAQFLAHAHYDLGFAPVQMLVSRLAPLVGIPGIGTRATAAQMALVVVMLCLALPAAWRTLSGIYCAAYWALPVVVGGQISMYRAEALLVPLAVLVPARARLPLLVAAIPISAAVSAEFFRSILI
jgi:hypothetical protein